MSNAEIHKPNIHLAEGIQRRMGYAQEFRLMIAEHQGILRTALQLVQKTENEYNPPNIRQGIAELRWNNVKTAWEVIAKDGETLDEPVSYNSFSWGRGAVFKEGTTQVDPETGLEVTILGKASREIGGSLFGDGRVIRVDKASYFKMRLGNQSFFVKKAIATVFPGYEEFEDTVKAREALRGIENLKVVNPQLGYADNTQSWFVSKWEDLESEDFFPIDSWPGGIPNDYGKYRGEGDLDSYIDEIPIVENRVEAITTQIQSRLAEIGMEAVDLEFNLFHNFNTGQFLLLDVSTTPRRRLGQP